MLMKRSMLHTRYQTNGLFRGSSGMLCKRPSKPCAMSKERLLVLKVAVNNEKIIIKLFGVYWLRLKKKAK